MGIGPFFSVVIPAFNAGRYLPEALSSLLNQDYSDWEAIVVDDGSSDNTLAIAESFAEKDCRIHVIHQDNSGPFAARRKAYGFVRGRYILHLDSDDAFLPGALRRLSSVLGQREWDIVLFEYTSDAATGDIKTRFPFNYTRTFEGCEIVELLNLVASSDCLNTMWSKAIKSELVLQAEYPSDILHLVSGEDRVQSLCVLDRLHDAIYLREPLYFYRVTPGGTTLSFREGDLENGVISRLHMLRFVKKWQTREGFIVSADDVGKSMVDCAFNSIKQSARYQGFDGARKSSLLVSLTGEISGAVKQKRIKSRMRLDERIILRFSVDGHHCAAAVLSCLIYRRRR